MALVPTSHPPLIAARLLAACPTSGSIDQLACRLGASGSAAKAAQDLLAGPLRVLIVILSGLLIVIEDQYGVGDSVTLGDTVGTVEGVSLRTTRIRALDGVVWYVPNGEIRKVGNSSEGYNQAVVDIDVPAGTDLTRVAELAADEATAMASEAEWHDVILGPPAYWGVQSQTHEAVTIRVLARTTAGEHLRTPRAMRSRLVERLRREGVAWATAASASAPAPTAPAPAASPHGGAE